RRRKPPGAGRTVRPQHPARAYLPPCLARARPGVLGQPLADPPGRGLPAASAPQAVPHHDRGRSALLSRMSTMNSLTFKQRLARYAGASALALLIALLALLSPTPVLAQALHADAAAAAV